MNNPFSNYFNYLQPFSVDQILKLLEAADLKDPHSFFYSFDILRNKEYHCRNLDVFLGMENNNVTLAQVQAKYYDLDSKQVKDWSDRTLALCRKYYFPSHEFGIKVKHRFLGADDKIIYVERRSSVMYLNNEFPAIQYSICTVNRNPDIRNFKPSIELIYPEGTSPELIREANEYYDISDSFELTEIEIQILQGIFDGQKAKEIGEDIFYSYHNVYNITKKLCARTGMTKEQLIKYALKKGLIS